MLTSRSWLDERRLGNLNAAFRAQFTVIPLGLKTISTLLLPNMMFYAIQVALSRGLQIYLEHVLQQTSAYSRWKLRKSLERQALYLLLKLRLRLEMTTLVEGIRASAG